MILVTGGLGMIGAHTAGALVDAGYDVVATSHSHTDVPSFFDGRVQVESLDVTDRDAFIALGTRHDITDIVHLAGSLPGEDPVAFFRTETAGLLNALDVARAWSVRRFLVASSLGSYIGRIEVPWQETLDLPAEPVPHPIIAFKKAVEPLVMHAFQNGDVQPVILRIGSIWGPLMDPDSPFNPVMPYVNAALRGERLPTVHAEDGGDLCYAPDAGRAIALLVTTPSLQHRTYNVSSGRPFTFGALAQAVQRVCPDAQLEVLPGRSSTDENRFLDISRLTTETGFAASFDLEAAVDHYAAWRADNPR